MEEIAKHIQQITTSVSLDLKTDKLQQSLKQIGIFMKRWSSLILAIILLGSWILLTVLSGNIFLKEVLISSLIISILLILKGPNTSRN